MQTPAAYLTLNHEIAAQHELYESNDNDFYGKLAEAVDCEITCDQLMVCEKFSSIRPCIKVVEPLKDLFDDKINDFQLITSGNETKVPLFLFCSYASHQENRSVPIIFSHSSQFEYVVDNVRECQRSRFSQDLMMFDSTRE
jgi:hypothetical protein